MLNAEQLDERPFWAVDVGTEGKPHHLVHSHDWLTVACCDVPAFAFDDHNAAAIVAWFIASTGRGAAVVPLDGAASRLRGPKGRRLFYPPFPETLPMAHKHHKAQAATMLKKGIITQKAHDKMVAKIDAMAPPPAEGEMAGDPNAVGETVAPPPGAAAAAQNGAPPASGAAPSGVGADQARLEGQ